MLEKYLAKIKNNPSLILLYIIVLIPVVTMCYFLFADYSYREKEEVKKNEQMANVLAQNLDSYIANVKATLVGVSTLTPIQENNREVIEKIFQNLMLADEQVSLYWVTDINGKVIAKYPNSWPDKAGDKKFMEEILKDTTVISEPRKGNITGVEVITVSTLIKDDQGRTKGVIGASIPLENLRKKLLLKVGSTGYPILVTKKGTFLVHPQRDEINQKIKLDDPIFKVILQGDSGTLDIVAPFDGNRKFFSYVSLQEVDWIVLVIQPLSEFQAKNSELLTRNVVIIILAIFLVVLAAYFLVLLHKREDEARILQAEKLSVVGQLAAGMAHEIRNPLTSIRGFAQLAATRKEELSKEYLEIIISEVDRIEGIVKETMLLAKPTPNEFKPVNINHILEEVFALMKPETNLNDINFNVSFEDDIPPTLGEANQLKQVFINLIKNSIDAAPNAGGQISIDVKHINDKVVIVLKDNGSGIRPEILNKLGNPFISTKENGTGLGLMVTYRIIQNHNGKINVNSIIGIGTTFTIELPAS